MTFTQLHSSSKANLYVVTANNGKRLLIDPGVRWTKLMEALDFDVDNIVGCLVSHSHKDHCKSIRQVMKAGIDVYASRGTFWELEIAEDERRAIDNLISPFPFNAEARPTCHDVVGGRYFIIGCDDQVMLFATDTAFIREDLSHISFNIVAIECSFDRDILCKRVDDGKVNSVLAGRLLHSHMERKVTIQHLERLDLSRCDEIHLLHCSADNLDKAGAVKEIEEKFKRKVVVL